MNSDIQNRLLKFEEEPSPKVWNKIIDALDAEEQFPKRLYQFEEQPKPHVWQKITSALTEEQSARVLPLRSNKLWKYAAAAVIIILAGLSSVLLINKKTATETSAIINQSKQQKNIVSSPQHDEVAIQQPYVTNITVAENKISFHKNFIATKENIGAIPTKNISIDNLTPECLIAEVKDRIKHLDLNTADHFMVYCCDKNGNPVRVPKKVYDAMACAEVDASCKQNIQCLQEKVSAASFSTDFMGVLQIIKQVQENQ